MNEFDTTGGDDAVEAALASLASVAQREQQLLGNEAIAGIARAAAAERAGLTVDSLEHGPLSIVEVEPVGQADPTGIRPRPGRPRSLVALAAALLVTVGIGGAILAARPEQVVTQDSAAIGPDRPSPASPGSGEAERPVLDLGGAIATTTETTSPNTRPTDEPPSSTATTEPSTTAPTVTAPPSTGPPATDVQPSAGDWLAIEVGVGGTVELQLEDSRPQLGRIVTAPGWSAVTITPRPGAFGQEFSDGTSVASLEIWSEPGWFRLAVDHGRRWPSSPEWTRAISIDGAGTVDVSFGTHGLSGLEILVGAGWQHRVDSVGPDHLLVVLRNPDRSMDQELQVDAGPVRVDLRIVGS